MRKSALITAVLFIISLGVNAQMMKDEDERDEHMMQQMMMGNMMCPMNQQMMGAEVGTMKPHMMMVHMLPAMQTKLDLTDEQVDLLIDKQAELKKQMIKMRSSLLKSQKRLNMLIENDANKDEIKSLMMEQAHKRIDMKLAAYSTAKEMKQMLNEDQQQKMKKLFSSHGMHKKVKEKETKKEMHHHMD